MRSTWLSKPSIISMEKKRMAHREDMGSWVTACGYAKNAKPGPERHTEEHYLKKKEKKRSYVMEKLTLTFNRKP